MANVIPPHDCTSTTSEGSVQGGIAWSCEMIINNYVKMCVYVCVCVYLIVYHIWRNSSNNMYHGGVKHVAKLH